MVGVVIFNPVDPEVGFSTGDDQAAGVFLDIAADAMYFTDAVNIYKWEGDTGTDKTYVWRSGKIRLPKKVNLGACVVEADSYADLTFRLYADGALKFSASVSSIEPFRLPGGYLSNIYEIELTGTDVVTGASVAENIFELAKG